MDKNIGPAILDKATYIKQALSEHLLTKDYQPLNQEEAKQKIATIKMTLTSLINNNQNLLSHSERLYFQ
jgi:uncharacterized protein YaaW (UPF0174 family)